MVLLWHIWAAVLAATPVFEPKQLDSFLSSPHPPLFLALTAPWCGHCQTLAPHLDVVAHAFARFQNNVRIASIDADIHREVADAHGLERYPLLKFFGRDDSAGEVYGGDHTADAIIAFINGKTGLTVRPKHNVPAYLTLTDANFTKIALDPARDVFVMFSAPWCGHCRAMQPAMTALANAFADESSCLVAELDADKYRQIGDRFEVRGLPTFKLFPRSSGDPKKDSPHEYSGSRDLVSFIAYLNERCRPRIPRTEGGLPVPEASRTKQLDLLAEDFMRGDDDPTTRRLIFQKCLETGGVESFYCRVMAKVLESNESFIAKELERIMTMLEYNTLSPSQITQLGHKLNILDVFVEAVQLEGKLSPEIELE